jgi:hypothetical protein
MHINTTVIFRFRIKKAIPRKNRFNTPAKEGSTIPAKICDGTCIHRRNGQCELELPPFAGRNQKRLCPLSGGQSLRALERGPLF